MKTRKHISAGTIIFRTIHSKRPSDAKAMAGREYLLLYYLSYYWDLPKGTVEEGETMEETATREAKEETGLDVNIIDGFKEKIKYFYRETRAKNPKQNGQLVFKQVIFFIAEATSNKVKISDEHSDFIWLPFEKAITILKYKTAKEILTKAEEFLVELKI